MSTYLDRVQRMLSWAEKKRSINQRVPIENDQIRCTENARDATRFRIRQGVEYEISSLIISMSLFLHLKINHNSINTQPGYIRRHTHTL